MKNLQCQMSLMANDIKNMTAFVTNFASCKACIKKLYKAASEPQKLCPVLTPFIEAATDPARKRLFTPPAPTLTPDEHSKETARPCQRYKHHTNVAKAYECFARNGPPNGPPPNVVLIGSPS